jgi:Protein of unknown function (DUF1565)
MSRCENQGGIGARVPARSFGAIGAIGAIGAAMLFVYASAAFAYGPFPPGTTVFVDRANTSGVEDGSQAQPFDTIGEGIDAAPAGGVVGVAPGTYPDETGLVVFQPIQLLGYDAATTSVLATEGEDLLTIDSPHVRVAGFTFVGQWEPGPITETDPCTANILVQIPDPSVLIEQSVLKENCYGLRIDEYAAGSGPILTRLDIHDNPHSGIFGVASQVSNSIIRDNGWGYALEKWVPANAKSQLSAVNNTFVNNGVGLAALTELSSGVVKNNVFAGHTAAPGFSAAVRTYSSVLPAFLGNLFHDNSEALVVTVVGPCCLTYSSGSQLNALAGSQGNADGDPKLASASNPQLTSGSAAIDSALGAPAPAIDFAGNTRPVDGDGDCVAQWDAGAYEAGAKFASQILTLGRCIEWVFSPANKWLFGGCAIIDCCPFCPGLAILDWQIYALGSPVEAVVVRIDGLGRRAFRNITIQGRARWLSPNELLVLGGERVMLRGLVFPDPDKRPALRMTAETFVANEPKRRGTRGVMLTQSVRGAIIAEAALEY